MNEHLGSINPLATASYGYTHCIVLNNTLWVLLLYSFSKQLIQNTPLPVESSVVIAPPKLRRTPFRFQVLSSRDELNWVRWENIRTLRCRPVAVWFRRPVAVWLRLVCLKFFPLHVANLKLLPFCLASLCHSAPRLTRSLSEDHLLQVHTPHCPQEPLHCVCWRGSYPPAR